MLPRLITLPIEAASAIRQILGILDDHAMPYPGGASEANSAKAAEAAYRAVLLEDRVYNTWTADEWDQLQGDDRSIELEIEDAALLLDGLAFTETMSVDLPWIDMVRWTVDFITAELRPLWTDDEWATQRT